VRRVMERERQAVARLEALESDDGLLVEDAFAARASALEELEADIPGAVEALAVTGVPSAVVADLARRIRRLRDRLERVDRALFARLRDGIREGSLRGEALRRALLSLAPPVRGAEGGYDVLDTLISGALLDEQPPATVRPELQGWDPEMVPYQPTPARIVLELATRLRPTVDDVFCDLGAGLGQVCVLVHLLTGVRAVGIEVDPALWAYSERLARRLGLADVTFFVGDARQADLTMGTLFFLYTPFTGTLLAAVLARIGELAARHRIRVASYGPCTSWVAREGWLMPEDAPADDPERLVLFRSR
jgi:hypothetical protein